MDNDTKNLKTKTGEASFSTRPQRRGVSKLKRPDLAKFKSRQPSKKAALILFIVLCFAFGLIGGVAGSALYYHNHNLASTSVSQKQQYVSNESQLIAGIAKDVGQSVVSVDVTSQTTAQDFFGFVQSQNQQSAGTGFIINTDGTIVTNRHVVPAGTTQVSVTLADGTRYDNVQVIGRTSDSSPLDIAFLKISDTKGKRLVPVTLGDSSKMQVGDKVVAIGNALGQFQNTVTAGIISGYGRDLQAGDQSTNSSESLTDLFQTDAAINEGNSGGPLVNINGEVIGVNTAIASGAQNIGFSIPVNDLKGLISSVLGSGKLEQPYLGVHYISLTADIAYQLNLNVTHGAYIAPTTDGSPSIIAGSPAAKAGLKEKDIISKVNATSIDDKNSLTSVLSRFKVGDTVKLSIIRGGKTISLKATLTNAPQS